MCLFEAALVGVQKESTILFGRWLPNFTHTHIRLTNNINFIRSQNVSHMNANGFERSEWMAIHLSLSYSLIDTETMLVE